jgi:hypothetical protein
MNDRLSGIGFQLIRNSMTAQIDSFCDELQSCPARDVSCRLLPVVELAKNTGKDRLPTATETFP